MDTAITPKASAAFAANWEIRDQACERRRFKDEMSKILESSGDGTQHAYLSGKGVSDPSARCYVASDSSRYLVIPIFGKAGWQALAMIDESGRTAYMRRGGLAGCYSRLGPRPDKSAAICIVTGYVTGLSVYEATGYSTAVCWNIGNLLKVATAIRQQYSHKQIIVCADGDEKSIAEAETVAHAIYARVAHPRTAAVDLVDFKDFNFMHNALGIAALRQAIIPDIQFQESPQTAENNETSCSQFDLTIESAIETEQTDGLVDHRSRGCKNDDTGTPCATFEQREREENINAQATTGVQQRIREPESEECYALIKVLGRFISENKDKFDEIPSSGREPSSELLGWRVNIKMAENAYLFTVSGLRKALQGYEIRSALNQLEKAGVIPRAGNDGKRSRVMRVGGFPRRIYSVDACKLLGDASA